MPPQATVFDQCRNGDDIHAQLQHLMRELLTTIQRQRDPKTPLVDRVDLNTLAELSYGDLKEYDHPVYLLSEICRLLIKLGDRNSLLLCLALSHKIYTFDCKHNESWYVSYLYKGIAQIGLQHTELGIKNVRISVVEHQDFSLVPIDQTLGYWALMSAAIAEKNLNLATTLAEKWHNVAQRGGFSGELFRAQLVMLLFRLLYGDRERCSQGLAELAVDSPVEWKNTLDVLIEWTNAMTEGRCPEIQDLSDPYPLFLGMTWYSSLDVDHFAEETPADFSVLCALRRNFCDERTQDTLPTSELERYVDIMAEWELPRPLSEFEAILRKRGYDEYFHSNLTRVLGKHALQKMLRETPMDPNIVSQDEAIIWVMDVRKFSTLSEVHTPYEIFELLKPVFKIISEELEQIDGAILEFIGDSLLIVFNTFKDQRSEISAILAHTIRSLQRMYVLNTISHHVILQDIRIGVGIHTGPVALGYLGGLKRCHLTVLGNTVNFAARLENASKEFPADVIVSAACFAHKRPEVWTDPMQVNFSVRSFGEYRMKNITTPVHLFGLKPLLHYWVDFVPMGFVARPEKGVIYLDTGNSQVPGIIDHHFEGSNADSACELLLRKPELLLNHVEGLPASQIEFRLHTLPDLDCAASLYAAQELLDTTPRHDLLWRLAVYVSSTDQAKIPHPEWMSESLYGIFKAHQLLVRRRYSRETTDRLLLEAGLRVIDAAMYLLQEHADTGDLAGIFRSRSGWFAKEKHLLRGDLARYQEDLTLRSHTYTARVNGIPEPVIGLWLDHPSSIFFRIWAWTDLDAPNRQGFPFLAVDLSEPGKTRVVIGVAPESGRDLKGLGQLMEAHETRKRKQLGKERPIHPTRSPADNSDPWYFGQGHNYAVIDSPGQGTVLTAKEVQKIHEQWEGSQ